MAVGVQAPNSVARGWGSVNVVAVIENKKERPGYIERQAQSISLRKAAVAAIEASLEERTRFTVPINFKKP
jgi:hypothetical protein